MGQIFQSHGSVTKCFWEVKMSVNSLTDSKNSRTIRQVFKIAAFCMVMYASGGKSRIFDFGVSV